ncbi:MAG: hypothetical protein PHH12_00565 [Candidatus Shapirobacteria bacterium]|jgi:hypothetical protein|nr:hypothetical protein [Candidatus Shapirobacteria bacterium]
MKEDLNLLPSVAKFQAAKIKLKKNINLSMGAFLVIWVLIMAIVFTWFWFSNYLLVRAKKENSLALDQYKTLVNNVVLSKKNKYQAKIVGKVLSERFEYGDSINKITTFFSDNVIIEDFEIREKKQFILKGFLENAVNMIEVEEKVRDINAGYMSDFKAARISKINVGGNGWVFEMEVDLI